MSSEYENRLIVGGSALNDGYIFNIPNSERKDRVPTNLISGSLLNKKTRVYLSSSGISKYPVDSYTVQPNIPEKYLLNYAEQTTIIIGNSPVDRKFQPIKSISTKGLLIDEDDIATIGNLLKKISDQKVLDYSNLHIQEINKKVDRLTLNAADLGFFIIFISITLFFANIVNGQIYIHPVVSIISIISGLSFVAMDYIDRRELSNK